ncbi:tRNA lysidine(34) synthetase TilS [Haloflavibacter putidus]|uniref:tRNA(Ile)-lysidine synthase n=1 Tax=Haloflavibacter putidus TaxID=2576776 RepID=A0A507ZSS5_9FLAO|nr:tRNA lysidine(34) synthetase TilS [Haloflavibacter putidus]TQD40047.1 tRNA lysidine(34) synthetase TilS [Haloflavibacter putidus]
MLQLFKNHLAKNLSYLKPAKLLLAVSGGLDSVVMAHLCKQAELNFVLAHCNFKLRGKASDQDEDFVKELATSLDVEIYTQGFATTEYAKAEKLSTQVAARDLRYAWFYELLAEHELDYVLTAHHANDSLETMLINLSRGTGLKGLTGIPENNNKIVRPLLPFNRKDLENFAEKNKINWRHDQTNDTDDYFRNRIRHQVVPPLVEENSQLFQTIQKTQANLKQTEDLLEDYTAILFSKLVQNINGEYYINVEQLLETPHTKAVLYQLLNSFGFTEWNDIYNLLHAQTGKQVFSATHRLVRDRAVLILAKKPKEHEKTTFLFKKEDRKLNFSGKLLVKEIIEELGKPQNNLAFLDYDKLDFPLKLRKWQAGDAFCPFGMKGTKKLSDFLKDEKVSPIEKENVWVLMSGEKIVWVINHRIDNRFKVEKDTKKIVKFSLV